MTLGINPEGTEKHLESRMCVCRQKAIIRLFRDLASLSQMCFLSGALVFRQKHKSLVKSKSLCCILSLSLTAIWLHMLLRACSLFLARTPLPENIQ